MIFSKRTFFFLFKQFVRSLEAKPISRTLKREFSLNTVFRFQTKNLDTAIKLPQNSESRNNLILVLKYFGFTALVSFENFYFKA